MPDKGYYDNWNIDECDKDEYNAYQSRGFAVQLGEDFKPITNKNGEPTYGAPTWMPWIVTISYGVELDRNPGPVAASIEERVIGRFYEYDQNSYDLFIGADQREISPRYRRSYQTGRQ